MWCPQSKNAENKLAKKRYGQKIWYHPSKFLKRKAAIWQKLVGSIIPRIVSQNSRRKHQIFAKHFWPYLILASFFSLLWLRATTLFKCQPMAMKIASIVVAGLSRKKNFEKHLLLNKKCFISPHSTLLEFLKSVFLIGEFCHVLGKTYIFTFQKIGIWKYQ